MYVYNKTNTKETKNKVFFYEASKIDKQNGLSKSRPSQVKAQCHFFNIQFNLFFKQLKKKIFITSQLVEITQFFFLQLHKFQHYFSSILHKVNYELRINRKSQNQIYDSKEQGRN